MPEYKFYVPPGLALPDATYWRSLGLTTTAAWYVLTVRSRAADDSLQSFLLVWDTDVVDAISSLEADLEGLLFVAPYLSGKRQGWFSRQINEVWEATDPGDDDRSCVVFVGEDGVEYSGYFMERAEGVKRTRLVARTRSASIGVPRSAGN